MTLRFKALTIVTVMFLALIGILYAISERVILQSFARLEKDLTQQNIERVEGALVRELTSLETITKDWSVWDDTYEYVVTRNQEYTESNLTDGTFTTLKLNLMLITDASGNIVFGKAFDLAKEEALPVPQSFRNHLSTNTILVAHPQESLISGIIALPENPLLISSHLILTSEEEGPPRGTLIMARYLDAVKMEALSEQTLLSFNLFQRTDSQLPVDIQTALSSLSDKTQFFIQPLSSEQIAGYTLLKDIYGKPTLVLRVDTPRDVYNQGRTSYIYYLALVVAIGVAAMIATVIFVEKQVLSRLAHLSASVSAIGKSGNPSARVSMAGKDELVSLADEINRMLAAIERFQSQLNGKNEQLNFQAEELKQKQQQLMEKSNELRAASQAKSDFIADLSHEIRTPLNAILGFSELLLDNIPGTMNEEQGQCLRDIHNSGEHLLNLINDALDLSKIEAGKMETKLENISLPDFIQSAVETIKPLIENNRHQLTVHIPDGLSPIYADEKRLKQAILNLLSNAVKFTPPGGKLAIEINKDGEGEWCQVSIIDNGVGIKKEDQERIFEAFVQAEAPSGGTKTGTGLGLALTRQFVGIWGGRIWIESEYGKGSKFAFTVPFAKGYKSQTSE